MKKIKLDKKDIYRALITDTSTEDAPVIFYNDGLYINCHSIDNDHPKTDSFIIKSIFNNLLKGDHGTKPYKYATKKSDISLRTLSLAHPRSQLNLCTFIYKNSEAIIYMCSKSKASIRTPRKVSNSLYIKGSSKEFKYKETNIDTLENEISRRHSSSYFIYYRFNMLYELFNDKEYIELERKYANLCMLDVANCFDSIYTHSISWAAKEKEYIKSKIKFQNQFCNEFDKLMRRSNNNETNGIPIGSEVSRIFSEVIFQAIDYEIVEAILNTHKLEFDVDYKFYRYVDDYVIFSNSEGDSKLITKIISDNLSKYNLYLNENKTKSYSRPFTTEKSSVITLVKRSITDLDNKLFSIDYTENKKVIKINPVGRTHSLIQYFIENIKSICGTNNVGYPDVSSYLVSTFSNRIITLIDNVDLIEGDGEENYEKRIKDYLLVLLELIIFFYSVYPQISSSSKLSKTIMLVDKFIAANLPHYSDYFRTLIIEKIKLVYLSNLSEKNRDGYVALEILNVLISTNEFGENYLMPIEDLGILLKNKSNVSYYTIISLLYYIQDHNQYNPIKENLIDIIIDKIGDCSSLYNDSEALHLFLDIMSCPYVDKTLRLNLLHKYLKKYEPQLNLTSPENINTYLDKLQSIFWFVKWKNLNLIKLLERKELKKPYQSASLAIGTSRSI